MKVGIVTNIASPYQVDLFAELNDIVDRLYVYFLAESERNRDWEPLRSAPFDFEYVVPRINAPGGYLNPRLPKLMRQTDCDVWVLSGSYTYPSSWLGRRAARKGGIPWIFWGERPSSLPLSLPKKRYLSQFLRSASAVWGVSNRACDAYAAVTPSEIPCVRIPYAVPPPTDRQGAASTGQRQDTRVSLALVGQLTARKNPTLAVETVALLAGEGMSVALDVIGDGPLAAELRALADQLRAEVTFSGSIPRHEVLDRLAGADAMLFPTREDGWGVVVMEALGVGTPVVGSRYGDALLEANEVDPSVAVCTDSTPESMAAAVIQLSNDGAFTGRERHSDRAREVAARFSTPAVAGLALDSLQAVTASGKHRRSAE